MQQEFAWRFFKVVVNLSAVVSFKAGAYFRSPSWNSTVSGTSCLLIPGPA